jgi:hypothetical protein
MNVIYEVICIGNSVKVSAIDAHTGVEVAIVGNARMPLYSLKANALRKLRRALEKQK